MDNLDWSDQVKTLDIFVPYSCPVEGRIVICTMTDLVVTVQMMNRVHRTPVYFLAIRDDVWTICV